MIHENIVNATFPVAPTRQAHKKDRHTITRFPPQSYHNHPLRGRTYQLNAFFPLALLLIRIFLPPRVRSLARNPWRRFCTLREGLYVIRFPARQALAEKGRVWLFRADVSGDCNGEVNVDVGVVLGVMAVVVVGREGEMREVRREEKERLREVRLDIVSCHSHEAMGICE